MSDTFLPKQSTTENYVNELEWKLHDKESALSLYRSTQEMNRLKFLELEKRELLWQELDKLTCDYSNAYEGTSELSELELAKLFKIAGKIQELRKQLGLPE